MSKRNVIGELVMIRKRNRKLDPEFPVISASEEILRQSKFFRRHLRTVRRWPIVVRLALPVRAVACLQSYMKQEYALLIDHHQACLNNCQKVTEIKFQIEHLSGIRREGITLGAFIAHFLQPNSWSDLLSTTSGLIGCDFPELLKAEFRSSARSQGSDWVRFFANMKDLFDLRHEICHEIFPRKVSVDETLRLSVDCVRFMYSTHSVLRAWEKNQTSRQSQRRDRSRRVLQKMKSESNRSIPPPQQARVAPAVGVAHR